MILLFLALLGLAAGRSKPRSALVVDPAAEQRACFAVLQARPQRWDGRTRPRGELEVAWLARVAFQQTYGRWPALSNALDLERYGAILACTSQTSLNVTTSPFRRSG